MKTGTLISIIYFSANIILLFILGYYVKVKGEYESIKSRAFLKDVWSQRTIYAPLIVHFYDTATDIGVVYYWYQLMVDDNDYESVNLEIFFWCGISFLILYRFFVLLLAWNYADDEGEGGAIDAWFRRCLVWAASDEPRSASTSAVTNEDMFHIAFEEADA